MTLQQHRVPSVTRLITPERSIIPALDISFTQMEPLVEQTADLEGIGSYKIPATAGAKGWETWVRTIRRYTNKPIIYDHQKAGTDTPHTAPHFMHEIRESGIDAVILYPQAGPITATAWINAVQQEGLEVLVGGRMSHEGYTVSEGGWITDEGAMQIYELAAKQGVRNFVVPGNKPDVIKEVRTRTANVPEREFYALAFGQQGGNIAQAAMIAGRFFHAIVGRDIYHAPDKRAAAQQFIDLL